jgi:acetylornithine deacetylase/succinyl-diaminopimelate desuccinylase-like protein
MPGATPLSDSIDADRPRTKSTLFDWLRSPSISAQPDQAVGVRHSAASTARRVWGTAPLFTREGGSGPEEALGRVLGAPVFFLGVGLPGDRIHAPNERMAMDQFWRGLLAAGVWHELAAEGRR